MKVIQFLIATGTIAIAFGTLPANVSFTSLPVARLVVLKM